MRTLRLPDALLLLLLAAGCAASRAAAPADAPRAGTAGGAGLLVVSLMDASRLALVDGATREVLASLETGKSPHEVRVSPDGRSAYVAAGKVVTAVDLAGRKVRAHFDLGDASAHDIRVSRDGRRLWAACAGVQKVLELDAQTGAVLAEYGTGQPGAWFVEVTPDERKLYTPNLEGKSVSVIDRAAGTVKTLPFAHPVYGIDITPDGAQVWVTGQHVTVIDTATDTVLATVQTPEPGTGRLRLTADGSRAVVALRQSLVVLDTRTHRLLGTVPLEAPPKVLTLTGDGRHAYLSNPGAASVSVVDLATLAQVGTLATGTKPDGVGWVPGPL
jgi:YVTN family beta-propeller protein